MLLETTESTVAEETVAGKSPANPQATAAAMLQLLFGKHITHSISAIARLGVADQMDDDFVEIETLARKAGARPASLYRVLRALAAAGVFEETAGKCFRLTCVGRLLKSDVPGSFRHLAIQFGDEWAVRSFEHFTETVRTGVDGVRQAYGKNVFEFFADEPEQAQNFNRCMTSFSAAMSRAIVNAYDFSSFRKIADIGGGHGLLLAAVLNHNPDVQGVLYDLPEVAAGAFNQPHFAKCADRLRVEAGSFFERVPENCDGYMMKSILHDWSDDHCLTILQRIREQLPPHGRVLAFEQVVATNGSSSWATFLDLEMLAMTVGGQERTAAEFANLFLAAGMKLTKMIPTQSPMCILEARLA